MLEALIDLYILAGIYFWKGKAFKGNKVMAALTNYQLFIYNRQSTLVKLEKKLS